MSRASTVAVLLGLAMLGAVGTVAWLALTDDAKPVVVMAPQPIAPSEAPAAKPAAPAFDDEAFKAQMREAEKREQLAVPSKGTVLDELAQHTPRGQARIDGLTGLQSMEERCKPGWKQRTAMVITSSAKDKKTMLDGSSVLNAERVTELDAATAKLQARVKAAAQSECPALVREVDAWASTQMFGAKTR